MDALSKRIGYAASAIREEDLLAERLARQGKSVTKLNIGDPAAYFKTPQYIIDAYIEALKRGRTGYSNAIGIPELRSAIARKYEKHGAGVTKDDVIVTQGVSEALQFINSALINPKDRAVLFTPYYAPYISYLKLNGGNVLEGKCDERRGWEMDLDLLEKRLKGRSAFRPKYLMITNPSNPTGTVLSTKTLKRLVTIANEHGMVLISDEIYDEIVYNGAKFTSMAGLAGGVPHMIIHGASKCYDSTGFRMGFIIIPGDDKVSEGIKGSMRDLANLRLSSNTPAQYAMAEAIGNAREHKKAVKSMVKQIAERVNYASAQVNSSGFMHAAVPKGAFYIFPRLYMERLRIKDDKEFVRKLLEEKSVQLARGSGFGADGYIRIVALADKETLHSAIGRIEDFCREHSR